MTLSLTSSRRSLTRVFITALFSAVALLPFAAWAASLSPDTLPVGVVSIYYDQIITAPSSLGPLITWSHPSSELPPGLALSADTGYTVHLKGTPLTAGTYTFRIRASDVTGGAYEQPYTFVVETPVVINTDTLPSGTTESSYSVSLSASGGTGPYRWNLVTGTLPAGLTLDTVTGRISGIPSTAGTYSLTLEARDSYGVTARKDLTVTVAPTSSSTSPMITTNSLPSGTVNSAYVADLNATGGRPPYDWFLVSGSLPTGLSWNASGALRGTPAVAGTFSFTAQVRDANGNTATRSFNIMVNPVTSGGSDLDQRLANFSRIGVRIHDLVKLPDDGNRFTQADSAVYYLGNDGRRHAFPNDKVYFSWYSEFGGVRVINGTDLASTPLGVNVTYHPGVKMVKFQTDPKVYAVSGSRVLRWVATETAARSLYGSTWNRQIDDISDTFYTDYSISLSSPITSVSEFNPASVRAAYTYPSEVMP